MWFQGARLYPKWAAKFGNIIHVLDLGDNQNVVGQALHDDSKKARSPKKVIEWSCESEGWIVLKTIGCWICQNHGLSTKQSYTLGMQPIQETKLCYSHQSQEGGAI